ncbi:hypothetical protein NADFUDRAFT_52096 [Nadsonia fulvescens var. elongata DSM 6958]|uniref:Uncharacterized protein n=1 Tax=Nadsonia fulvescens var. elongata DSM 6958 TaxID=857566 RepID=A0A1E3PHW8_9ASCO|nr:hypothetical protein NADFUDRAFT_52096 [Nadsonia fulvescens var. elongata DSM 6958]
MRSTFPRLAQAPIKPNLFPAEVYPLAVSLAFVVTAVGWIVKTRLTAGDLRLSRKGYGNPNREKPEEH